MWPPTTFFFSPSIFHFQGTAFRIFRSIIEIEKNLFLLYINKNQKLDSGGNEGIEAKVRGYFSVCFE